MFWRTGTRSRARRLKFEMLEARQLLVGDPITGLGIAGDSLSDEYAVESYSYARNWDELLAEEQGINFGPAGNYAEPRRMGHAYNWARAGATSQTLLDDGQHTALAAQIEAGMVSHAVLSIGPNDFLPDLAGQSAYVQIALGLWTQQQIQAYSDQVVANIETALETLAATDVHLAMSNISDYGVAPLVRANSMADQRQRVTVVIDAINVRLEDMAEEHGVPLVDLNGVARHFFGPNDAPTASWEIGGMDITNTAGEAPTNAFVDDGLHPHTVVQAQIANLYLTAFNLAYDTPVDLFTEQETLALEGLAYGGSDTLNLDFASFVKLPVIADLTLSGIPASIGYVVGDPPALLAPAAVLGGADGRSFDGGALIASISVGGEAEDRLAIRHQGAGAGQIGVSGNQVLFEGTAIGTWAGGNGNADLVVSLNAQADGPAIQALLRNLTFENSDATPLLTPRTITLQLTDGDGMASNTATITASILVASDGWTNPGDPHDVDDDGGVDIQDLLQLVQFLRTRGLGALPPPNAADHPPPYVDVTDDGKADVADLLSLVQVLRG